MNPFCTSKPVRAFVAIALPQILVERLKQIQQQLQSDAGGDAVRWTKTAQLHVTLKFLGNVAEDALNDLKAALRRVCKGQAPFRLTLENPGCFPNTRNPRVIWLGISGELESLQELQTQIARETQTFGDHSEVHAFQPHLTIGRVNARAVHAKRVGQAVEKSPVGKVGTWTVSEIDLMQSRLTPQGAKYATLATLSLSSPLSKVTLN
jgi:2'-5' RNA ligase